MLAAYPKQTCKIQLLLLQIFRQEDFPRYKFDLFFFSIKVKTGILGTHLERQGS